MNKQQNLTEFWDDFISLEEPEIINEKSNEVNIIPVTKKFIEDNYRKYLKRVYGNSPNGLNKVEEIIDEFEDEDWEKAVNFFDNLKFPLKVFRGLEVKSKEDINLKNPGIHWTIDTKLFKVKNSIAKNSNYVLIGEVEKNQVDWISTISTYMYYSLRPSYGFYPENEITLKKGQIPNNLTIVAKEDLNESWWDDSDPWDSVIKEPETVSELLGKDFLYHATYKQYWGEIKKDGYIRPGKHTNWDNRYKTTRAIYLATDYDNAVYYAKNAENVPKELLNQIVVLKIDANKLDVDQLDADSNQIYDSAGDEGRSIEDPYTWKEVQYYKPIPVSAIVKVYDGAKTKESLNEVYPNKGESKKDFINRFMRVTAKEYPDVKQRYAVANSYWERRDRKKLKESEDHTQKAIDVFGTTYYKTRAGFMLKDGRLLDLTCGGGPREDHRNIQDAFDDVDLETDSDYLIKFMNEGNIRLIPEIPGIDVAIEPTVQQRKSLKDYIRFWINHERHFEIQYSNEKGQQIGWKEYNGYYPVDNIIEDLLNHFKLTEALSKETATAIIEGDQTHSELHGSVEFTQLDDSVRLDVELKGLPKSQFLGFHIHSGSECTGDEEDPFKDVGSHYNPGRRSHPDHAGDLPSLYSSTGEIDTSFETDRFKLKDVVGRAIIIHSQRDDFKSQPSGDAGSKIACGIIKEVPLTEAYLDPEERFWDYRTGQISGNKLFDTTRSESSYGQSFLDNLDKVDSRGRVGKIVEMSPTEYFKACAKGFGSSYDAQINQISADKDTYQLLNDVIDKYNRQFPIPYLDYSKEFSQEGRHRMYVAGERFGWNTKFPVLIIEKEESPLFELKENKDPSHKEKYVVTVNKTRALIYGNNKRDLLYKLSLIEDNISEEYFETIWKIIRNSNIG